MIERLSTVTAIIVHCSDSAWGNAAEIDKWHKARGMKGIGYHYVVCNGWPTPESRHYPRDVAWDGKIEFGRAEDELGAHCEGLNAVSLGVCFIGKAGAFSSRQLARGTALTAVLQRRHPGAMIFGHRETPSGKSQKKTCPELDMSEFRRDVEVCNFFTDVEAELKARGRWSGRK